MACKRSGVRIPIAPLQENFSNQNCSLVTCSWTKFPRLLARPSVRLPRTSEPYFVAVTVPLGALEKRSSAPNESVTSAQAERHFSTGETRLGASWGATRSASAPKDSHAPPAGRTEERLP